MPEAACTACNVLGDGEPLSKGQRARQQLELLLAAGELVTWGMNAAAAAAVLPLPAPPSHVPQ